MVNWYTVCTPFDPFCLDLKPVLHSYSYAMPINVSHSLIFDLTVENSATNSIICTLLQLANLQYISAIYICAVE